MFLKATKSRAQCPHSFDRDATGEWMYGIEYGDKAFKNPNVEPAGFSILHWPLPGWETAWEVCVFCVFMCVCVRMRACVPVCTHVCALREALCFKV